MKAIRIHELGGLEVLKYEDCLSPTPGHGQAPAGPVDDVGIRKDQSFSTDIIGLPMLTGELPSVSQSL